jgi:hypothetical protein
MKSLIAGSIAAIALCFGLALTTSRAAQEAGGSSHGGQIEGTWRVQVTLRNCQSGAEIRTFPAMLTFAQGGTLTGTSTVVAPSLRGGDFGIWQFNGHESYSAVSEAFLFSGGVWSQTQRITQAITLSQDANTFSSNAHTEFFDTAGNMVSNGCATAVATRMSL